MSRRSNSTKQKNKAKSDPSMSSDVPSLAGNQPSSSSSVRNELLAASLLDAITATREMDGDFSDYGYVNQELLESALATQPSLQPSGFISGAELTSSFATSAVATARDCEEGGFDLDSDFGADIFADETPDETPPTPFSKISYAELQELKEFESETWDEISLDDCSFEDISYLKKDPFEKSAIRKSATDDTNSEEDFASIISEEILEVEPACSDVQGVSAIDAAVEILSPINDDDTHRISSRDFDETDSDEEPATAEGPDQCVSSLRSELKELTETLRAEFRQSLESLLASQAAANAAQSEVLRTLTEIMFQSAGSSEAPADAIEKSLSGVEERLMARMDAMAGSVASSQSPCSATSPGPVATRVGNASPIKLQNAASSVTRSWEQIKNEMMHKGELAESTPPAKTQTSAPALPDVAQLTSDRHFRLPEQDLSLEIPKAIDPEAVSDQELRDAFREREAFITTLMARIRRQQESAMGQLSPEQLRILAEELPEELANQVRHTLKQMDDLARMGELELSLERARIARQVNQLTHSRHLLERNARQMGMIINADGSIVHGPNQAGRSSGSRRWLGKLGFGQ